LHQFDQESKDLQCFQAFAAAALTKERATGHAKDGGRLYGNMVIIRIVDSLNDGQSERSAMDEIGQDEGENTRVSSVTRVLYFITSPLSRQQRLNSNEQSLQQRIDLPSRLPQPQEHL
jgi:GMP synthase PP-ATPase subunit